MAGDQGRSGQADADTRRRPGPGILVARLGGVPVYLSPSWAVPAAFITFLYADLFTDGGATPGPVAYLLAFGVAVLVAVSVLVHESAHVLVARILGLPVRQVVLHLVGGVSEVERRPETAAREFLVAAAGPASSLVLAGAGLAAAGPLHGQAARYAAVFGLINGLVALLNLLPGLPLDGGRMLRAVLWRVLGDEVRASRAAAIAGRFVAAAVVGVPLAYDSLQPPAASSTASLDVLWAALVGMFIWSGATAELRMAELRRRLPAVDVRWLVRSALPVPYDLPLAEAVRRARAAGARAMVTVDARGRPEGLVAEAAVAATPPQRQPWLAVSACTRAIEPSLVLGADTSGDALLEVLRTTPASEYLVTESDGEVLGVLVTADVAAALEHAPGSASPRPAPPRQPAGR